MDTLFRNARVLTMNPLQPEAGAVSVAGARIVAVGREGEIVRGLGSAARVVDCRDRLLLPGFIDAHAHVLATASALAGVDCSADAAPSITAIVAAIRRRAEGSPAEAWVRAHGYHEASLAERRHPTRRELDQASLGRPVRLAHSSGHGSVLNSAALRAVGIDSATEEPAGGRIERDIESGEPNGVLIEMEEWLDGVVPHLAEPDLMALISRLSDRLLAAGVTSVADLGHRNDQRRAALLARAVAKGQFRPRLSMATGYEAFIAGQRGCAESIGLGPVKIMLNESGEALYPNRDDLARQVMAVHRAGRQVAVHATEERSVEAALDALDRALRRIPRRDHRHRIEHASMTPPELAAQMRRLGVVAVSNPAFIWANGDRYLREIPQEQMPWLYDVAGLQRAGAVVAAGSDCPVTAPEPILAIAAAMRRRSRKGAQLAGEPASFEAAISLYTSAAAHAGFIEHERGRIAPGLLADMVLLDGSPEEPERLKPVMTILGGQVAWQAQED